MSFIISDTFVTATGPTNTATINAYKASRFSSVPTLNTPGPGAPDYGPVTSGLPFGGPGQFQIAVGTNEPYYLSFYYNSQTTWKLYNAPNFIDGTQGSIALNGTLDGGINRGINFAAGVSPTDLATVSQIVPGPQGSQGSTGAQGNQGYQGFQGNQGLQGSQGVQGATGSQGAQGSQGATGAQGPQGSQGTQGNQGFQGATGSQGATGAQGNQGLQGSQGSQGTQGTQGSQGAQGTVSQPAAQAAAMLPVIGGVTTLAETGVRQMFNASIALTNGSFRLNAVYLTAGQVVRNITFCTTATTAGVGLTGTWGGLFTASSNTLTLVAATASQGLTSTTTNTVYTWPIATIASGSSSTYTVPTSGIYYVGVCITASTSTPTLTSINGTILNQFSPPIGFAFTGSTSPTSIGTTYTGTQVTLTFYYAVT